MSKEYTDFYDYVMPDVPGCLPAVATQAIRNAVREFCRRTHFWKYRAHAAMNVVADQSEYALTAPTNTEIVKVFQVNYSRTPTVTNAGRTLYHKSPDGLHRIYPSGWQAEEADEPIFITQVARNTLILVPKPQVAVTSGLTAFMMSLQPTLDSTSFSNEEIFDQYAEQIAMGAKYRLQMSPKKPYTDLNAAAANKAMFNSFLLTEASRVSHGLGNPEIGWDPLV